MLQQQALFHWFAHSSLAEQLWTQEVHFFQAALREKQPERVLQLGIAQNITHHNNSAFWVRQSPVLPANVLALDDCTPWQNALFDAVIAAHALDYAEDLGATLAEWHRIVQANGCLLLTGFNPHSLWRLRLHHTVPDVRFAPSAHDIKRAAQDVGWHCVSESFLYCLPPVALSPERVYRQWAEYAGSHLWRYGAAVYALILIKNVAHIQPNAATLQQEQAHWAFQAI